MTSSSLRKRRITRPSTSTCASRAAAWLALGCGLWLGLSPLQAARKAMQQISGAIIGVTVVLISVFVPLAFFAGSTGNIYRQFSVVMVASIAF